jgi:hypothetical protein
MKFEDALRIIKENEGGFRVHFEVREGSILSTDYFPAKDEPMIKDLSLASDFAKRFAMAVNPAKYVNIYIVDETYSPVPGYEDHIINKQKYTVKQF